MVRRRTQRLDHDCRGAIFDVRIFDCDLIIGNLEMSMQQTDAKSVRSVMPDKNLADLVKYLTITLSKWLNVIYIG